jgi:acyl-CoA thioesterase II
MDLEDLLDVLDLDEDAADTFVGRTPAARTRSIFGGQFLAQALLAAGATVDEERPPHSLHGYFLRAGDPVAPIRYRVERLRDGRSFSHRQVAASQDRRDVFRLLASFQRPVEGPDHDDIVAGAIVAGTTVAGAERSTATPTEGDDVDYHAWEAAGTDNPSHDALIAPGPVEIRYQGAPPPAYGQVVRGPQCLWTRIAGDVASASPLLHAALLAWLSDKTIADFATLAHGRRWVDAGADSLSLDHAMWFLRPARADRWLRFVQESPSSAGGRGITRGEFVDGSGRRVASVVQETLITLPALEP